MNTETLFQPEFAQVAYAEGLLFGTPEIGRLTDPNTCGMTPAQAEAFAMEWTVVNQLLDTASGFSGMLFQNNSTKEYALALRGTAGATDLSTDAGDIVLDGIALDQTVDMVNYWRSLHAAKDQSYQAVRLTTLVTETAALTAAYLLSPVAGFAYKTTLRASGYIIDYPSRHVRQIEIIDSTQLSGVVSDYKSRILI
jgi:hypothetical protein